MTSHLGVMILFAACVAVVFATLLRNDVASAWRLGARIFSGLVGGAVIVGWLMYAMTP